MSSQHVSRRCSATTGVGSQCRAWAMPHTDPPLCAAHSNRRGGAPAGNHNRQTHGFYAQPAKELHTIDDILTDALQKQAQLSAFIETAVATGEIDVETVTKLLALHGQNASRLGRLLRDKRALSGDSADGLLDAIGKVLDEISTELDVQL